MTKLIPVEGNKFKFRCHKDIPCFTKCCAKLNLMLTPYDVLRIKRRLGISSDEFIERYTDIDPEEYPPFPILKLKMNIDGRCPFVTEKGCSIYEDRPSACRLYPLARASAIVKEDKIDKFFIIKEKHCLGFNEDKTWTIEEWLEHEGVLTYDKFNLPWFKIVTSYENNVQREKNENVLFKKMQVFFMSSYNLDKFREFLFKSSFFEKYHVPESVKEKIYKEDEELLKFAYEWINFYLYGKKSSLIKPKS